MKFNNAIASGLLACLFAISMPTVNYRVSADELTGSSAIAPQSLRFIFNLTHRSPQAVYTRYGRPAFFDQNDLHGFGYVDEQHQATLLHAYDISGGGRVGFLYARDPDYKVEAIAFDNLTATRFLTLRDFFTPRVLPLSKLLRACIQEDAYHALPGDAYEWPNAIPNPTAVGIITTEWATSNGGLFFASFRLEHQYQDKYDPISGTTKRMPHLNLREAKLLTFFWTDTPGKSGVSDLYLGDHLGHISTSVISSPNAPCYQ